MPVNVSPTLEINERVRALPVVLPAPSWVSYEPQAHLANKPVIRVPIDPAIGGGVPDPRQLRRVAEELSAATGDGAVAGSVPVCRPDDPTGTVASSEALAEIVDIAERYDLVVISDAIHADLTSDGDPGSVASYALGSSLPVVSVTSRLRTALTTILAP